MSVHLLTASTRLLALPLFCSRCEQPSAGSCNREGEWLRLEGPPWLSVYHKLLLTTVGMLSTLPELRQSTYTHTQKHCRLLLVEITKLFTDEESEGQFR